MQYYKGFLLKKNQTLRVFSRTRAKALEISVGYSVQEPSTISQVLLGLAVLGREVNHIGIVGKKEKEKWEETQIFGSFLQDLGCTTFKQAT